MTFRTLTAAVTALIAAALLGACDNEEPGGTTPAPSTPTNSTGSPAAAKAPRVTDPLEAAAFVAAPCESLTAAQRVDFTLDDGEKDTGAGVKGETCIFRNNDAQVTVGVTFNPELTAGLSHLYEQNEAGWQKHWEPTTIDGYPAVFYSPSTPADGNCDLAVGITDSLFFSVAVLGNPGDDSCVAAENVASAVLTTIKAGGA